MAAPGNAPISVVLEPLKGSGSVATHALLEAMLRAQQQVSDLIFSPGKLPQVEVNGQLISVDGPGLRPLTADDTRRIASDLIGNNKQAINMLREQGSCDVSYGMPGLARFRVNVFIQRGSCAVVMRVIPTIIPSMASLALPAQLAEIAGLRDGIVLVTGPRGSGKSSTLAAILDLINQQQVCHIITIENPIEFLHNHKQATIHQRELHSDTPSIPLALRAAMRQAPNVILVSESFDRESFAMVLEAAETGHLVFTTLHTMDAAETLERVSGMFPVADQTSIRSRLAKTLRYIVSQRLVPRRDGRGRVPIVEILKVQPRTLAAWKGNTSARQALLRGLRDDASGLHPFDGEIAKLVRGGIVDLETGMAHATDSEKMRQELVDVNR